MLPHLVICGLHSDAQPGWECIHQGHQEEAVELELSSLQWQRSNMWWGSVKDALFGGHGGNRCFGWGGQESQTGQSPSGCSPSKVTDLSPSWMMDAVVATLR